MNKKFERCTMRSAKATRCFPYRSNLICYFEVFHNGFVKQLNDVESRVEALFRAKRSKTKICAVWPGKFRSDLFIIDDLEAFEKEQSLPDYYIARSTLVEGSNISSLMVVALGKFKSSLRSIVA